ncbi:MAG: adenylate cyclase [Solirubrobacteraceae bacterium]|nr:adenylate cyclase [Solirubrobacteraceae bacterium]
MTVDFEKEGLLEGVRGDDARAARRQLLASLLDDGFSLDELREAVAEDRLALLPVERVLGGDGARYTAAEVAEKVGVPLDFLVQMRRALGLGLPGEDERIFTDDDVRAGEASRVFAEAGLPEEGRLEVARVIGRAMSDVAAATRELSAAALVRPDDTELETAMRLARSTRLTLPQLGPVLESVVGAHLREQVRQEVVAQADASDAGLPGGRCVTVCFADLVDFTRLGESVEPERLGAVARRLVELTEEAVCSPVRVVKMIGDAAMMISPEPGPLIEVALELIDRARDEGEGFPELRAGVALGEAVTHGGDWYGRPVNLASRLTAIARSSSVLASQSVHDELEDAYRWSFAGNRRIKGLSGETALFRARRLEADDR